MIVVRLFTNRAQIPSGRRRWRSAFAPAPNTLLRVSEINQFFTSPITGRWRRFVESNRCFWSHRSMPTLPTLDRPNKQNHDTGNPVARWSVSTYGRAPVKSKDQHHLSPLFTPMRYEVAGRQPNIGDALRISSDERTSTCAHTWSLRKFATVYFWAAKLFRSRKAELFHHG